MPPKAKEKANPTEKKAAKPKESQFPPAPVVEKEKFKQLIDVKSAEIEAIQKKMDDIRTRLQDKSGDRNEHNRQRNELYAEIQIHMQDIKEINEHKKIIREQLDDNYKQKESSNAKLFELKDKQRFKNEKEVDDEIAKIESEIMHSTMSIADEKKKVQMIQFLKKEKPKVARSLMMESELKAKAQNNDEIAPVKQQIQDLKEKADQRWNEMQAIIQQKEKLQNDFNEQNGDIGELEKEMDHLRAEKQAKVTERNELRQELRSQEDALWRHQQDVRKLQEKKWAEEKDRMNAERNAKRFESEVSALNEQPHLAEVTALEQTIFYLASLLPKENEEKKAVEAPTFSNPEGSVVLVNKRDRDEEEFFVGRKKKCPQKKNKTQAVKSTVIKHSADTFRLFEALSQNMNVKVNAPTTTDQVPEVKAALEDQLAKYMDLVGEWKRKLEDGTLHKEYFEKKGVTTEKNQSQMSDQGDPEEV